jgi:quercetin 2,3-dioxygenase
MSKNSLTENSTTNPLKQRLVTKVIDSKTTAEGEGFTVNRAFPTHFMREIDPFLLLDEMGPIDHPVGKVLGFPDHPHRGFETVTYMLEGKFKHKDSHGHSGKLGPGDVQWMTAAAGVIHSEMPDDEMVRKGGRLHGFQLWVNLPRKDKMTKPHYQEIPSSKIPVAKSADGKVTAKVIAGQALDVSAVIETRTPILYVHFTLQPNAKVQQSIPANYNAFAYVFSGEGQLGIDNTDVSKGQIATFSAGDYVSIRNESNAPLDVLLIGGVPLNEPIARYGPFVMNEQEEIEQAIEDYRSGKMGRIES